MTNYELNNYFNDQRTLNDVTFDEPINFNPKFENFSFHIRINSCHFNGFRILDYIDSNLSITFEECQFENHQLNSFKNIECRQITFINCSFFNFSIQDSKILNLSLIWGGFNELNLKNIKGDSCSITTNRESDKLSIDLPDVKRVSLESYESQNSLFLNNFSTCIVSGLFTAIILGCNDFESLMLSQKKSSGARLSKAKIFSFKSKMFKGRVLLEQFSIGALHLEKLSGIESSIIINESTIESTHISDCNFQEFNWNQVEFINAPIIKRSDLRMLIINDVKWPNDKKLRDSKLELDIPFLYRLRNYINLIFIPKQISENQLSDLKYEKDTYRQLKLAAKENENIYDYLLFGNYEKRLHWKLVRIEGGEKWYDTILLFTDRHVSNFGFTWWKPLFWLFFFHYLLYFISVEFAFSIDKEMIIKGFNESIVLINPAHSTPEFMKEGYEWVSLLMRISSGFFIYHFLRATRKFARY